MSARFAGAPLNEIGDLDGVRLVVTATGVVVVDAAVADDARSKGIWVNAADQPADCDFILPAIARHGPVSVAVSTDGQESWRRGPPALRIVPLLTPALATLGGRTRGRALSDQGRRWVHGES